MKGAARFILDFLIEAPEGTPVPGKLVTNPSHSPENRFKKPDGTVKVCKDPVSEVVSRQTAPEVYEMNASMYVYDRGFLLDAGNKTPYAKTAYAYEMNGDDTIDIDSETDFKFIEFLVKEGIVKL